jgi:hypothetical protein
LNREAPYSNFDEKIRITDTIYLITATQLRATCLIFSEHSFLKSENTILNGQISILQRSGRAKDYIIDSQKSQINTQDEIIIKKDLIITNNNTVIESLKAQIKAEKKERKKYFLMGTGAGAIVVGVLVVVLK